MRWRHPVEGVLTPDKFLSVAEEAGLIVPITRWTIMRACKLAAEWRQRLPEGQRLSIVSINLSAAALRDPELSAYVAQVLKETGTPPRCLKFELTEGGLISNPGAMREILDGLHDLGIEMMLDDFGTGYSSLSYLQLFPFDYLKIDRPFVDRAGSERANSAIAAAIVQMAASLGPQVGCGDRRDTPRPPRICSGWAATTRKGSCTASQSRRNWPSSGSAQKARSQRSNPPLRLQQRPPKTIRRP